MRNGLAGYADAISQRKRNGKQRTARSPNGRTLTNDMDVWFTRDVDGTLYMHFTEPVVCKTGGCHWQSIPFRNMVNMDGTPIDEELSNLNPTDKPLKAKLKI